MIGLLVAVSVFTTQRPGTWDYYIDPSPVEVGMRFRSDVAGRATGVRFYKVAGNTGPHAGHLWTNGGALLATASFVSETASGWQTAFFPVPVNLQAGTTYVVSYRSSRGYAVTRDYFAAAGVDNPPLRAPPNSATALNGVYSYTTAAAAFPSRGTRASNYWVDVVFSYDAAPPNPAPALTALVPSSAPAGSPALTLQVAGSGFVSSSTVRWNGAARPTTFVNSTALTAGLSAADLASAGTASVTVFTPEPGGGTSNALPFVRTNPPPVLVRLSPSSAAAGTPFLLTAYGSGFVSTSTLLWNGAPVATTVLGSAAVSAQVLGTAPGTARAAVFNAAPGGGLSDELTVALEQPPPRLTALSPRSARAGGPGFTLLALGAGFTPAAAVLWNGAPRPTVFVGTGTLSASIAAADVAEPGLASVSVADAGLSEALPFSISSRTGWVGAYYTGWQASHLPIESVDFGAFDALLHFALVPNSDGTLNSSVNLVGPEAAARVVAAARAAGKPVLISVGGWLSQSAFQGAMSPANRDRFVANLVAHTTTYGYDGVDVDMEPMSASDAAPYDAFIRALRARLDAARPGALLTAAVTWQPQVFAALGGVFDRVNLMTYSLSGTWLGTSWHNAPVLSGGTDLPSAESMLRSFLDAGAPPEKLGLGVAFGGRDWRGVTGPRQSWVSTPTVTSPAYWQLADAYGLVEDQEGHPLYRWDTAAQAPYLSVASTRAFVSYDDRHVIAEKFRYARSRGLTGMIVWSLASGWRPGQPPGRRDLLLQAVKEAAAETAPPPAPEPFVEALSPSTAAAGGPGFTLAVLGSGFSRSSTVMWNGTPRPTVFLTTATLWAEVAAADVNSTGTATVAVGASARAFTILNPVPAATTATLFTTQLPGVNDYYIDPSPVEIGVRFRSDVAGRVRGIRFYKVAGNTGPHTGHLWTGAGALLGSAAFTGETAGGWQTALFASPIAIQPNASYVASYKSTRGYAVTLNYFALSGVDRPPLHAPQSSPGALNGVYAYSSAPAAFPAQSTRASNYWVDVLFEASAPATAALQPASIAAGGGGFTLEVRAAGVVPGSTVLWNGSPRPTAFVSDGVLRAQVFAADVASPGKALVTAATPEATGSMAVANCEFEIAPPEGSRPVAAPSPLKVFPNPWRAAAHRGWPITFASLAPGSEVRLYTLSGRWFKTLPAVDGRAVWDGSGSSGYVLYSATDARNRRVTGTIAIIK